MLQLLHVEGTINKKKFCKLEEEIGEELLKFEELEISHIVNEKKFFKFGILNWQAGNKNEEDLFSNQSISPVRSSLLSHLPLPLFAQPFPSNLSSFLSFPFCRIFRIF